MSERKQPHLSHRLQAIVDLLADGNAHYDTVADVGCDHGWVSIVLLQKGIADKVIASDVRPGPLERAREHVAQYGLEDRIDTVLSDGLSHIGLQHDDLEGKNPQKQNKRMAADSVDAAVIAGMGGMMICGILEESAARYALPETLLLQPQLSWQEVRQCLRRLSYRIVAEDMVKEDGKFYVILRARKELSLRIPEDEALDDRFGPCLLAGRHPVLKEWLCLQQKNFTGIRSSISEDHEDRDGIEEKLHYLNAALQRFEG